MNTLTELQLKLLDLRDRINKLYYSPTQPRVPKGSHAGGQFRGSGGGGGAGGGSGGGGSIGVEDLNYPQHGTQWMGETKPSVENGWGWRTDGHRYPPAYAGSISGMVEDKGLGTTKMEYGGNKLTWTLTTKKGGTTTHKIDASSVDAIAVDMSKALTKHNLKLTTGWKQDKLWYKVSKGVKRPKQVGGSIEYR